MTIHIANGGPTYQSFRINNIQQSPGSNRVLLCVNGTRLWNTVWPEYCITDRMAPRSNWTLTTHGVGKIYKRVKPVRSIRQQRAIRLATRPVLCEICQQPSRSSLQWDHDHKTGQFRGWLCVRCNPGLGYFQDSPEILTRALAYLQSHQ